MKPNEAKAEIYLTAFKSLPKKEKEAIITRLLTDEEFREDLIDIAIIEQRKNEPTRSLEEYLSEKKLRK